MYFYSATIVDWRHLLMKDVFKDQIIDSLYYLTSKNYINLYGFVIMPNHIHLIFEMNNMNGKEMPNASLMKYTSHKFKKMVSEDVLKNYAVQNSNRQYQFWQRNPLAIELFSRKVIEQKLDYVHANPVKGKWNLCKDIIDYKYSSCAFYETGQDNFGILKHYMEKM